VADIHVFCHCFESGHTRHMKKVFATGLGKLDGTKTID
jgi:hypothetical protein